ncbi:dihydroxy-acid dehydratase [Microbacterium sp. 18062]|uniref:dihydroxy-acid dehydratase n=1 Tax=Microbacterium sp. 18062 TaxID=2681410 RepID=UPI00135943B1|nr:dihydroxy-acid dehydratase [Microbacterium sp. 18062]
MNERAALRSNFPPDSMRGLTRRAEWASLGIPASELSKPKVAIVNASNDLAACYAHLDDIVPVLKEHLREAGALPFEIRTSVASDFITSVGKAGRYILPTRDLMVQDIEVVVEGAQLDAMICLSSCDKTTPAHLMAAGRLNVPTIIVPCGYQHSGLADHGGADIEDVFLNSSFHAYSGTSQSEMERMADEAILGPGVCSGLATANSMHIVAEVLGMAVAGAAPVRATSDRMWDSVRRSAYALVEAIHRDIRPRDVITGSSIRNAVVTMLAIGGSINTIKHLQAIAIEAGVEVDVWELYRSLGREIPLIASVRPNGPALIEEFEDAGGAATIQRELLPYLDADAPTVTGDTIGERAATAPTADGTVIRSVADPFATTPSIVVVKGTLAEEGAVVKRPIPDPGPYVFTGPAKIFHTREEGIEAIANGTIREGDVIVLRGVGLVGGPGMGFVSALIFAITAAGLAGKVAMVTDGQFSGLANTGIVVGEVSPEAATGGTIGLLEDDDRIRIDLAEGRVDVLVDPETLAARPPFVPVAGAEIGGYLDVYRAAVQPLACGAVLCDRKGTPLCSRRDEDAHVKGAAR